MSLNKQAKLLTPAQQRATLSHLTATRYPIRNKVIFLLSCKAGLRAKEIALLSWAMLTDAEGQLGDTIALVNRASKGKNGGREIPLNTELKAALAELGALEGMNGPVIRSERKGPTNAAVIANMMSAWYKVMGFAGCSSHSGRRTFITGTAKKVAQLGLSLKDVQMLAGHSSLATTQRYIEGDTDGQKKLVNLI